MPNELKPCPFCGGQAKLKKFRSARVRFFGIIGFYVECSLCKARTALSLDKDDVDKAWNRRTK